MQINSKIFKAYDIRGVYPEELNEEIAEKIGRGLVRLLREENPGKRLRLGIARDMRLSSPGLRDAVVKGITESGADVVDCGLLTTPGFYFAVAYYGLDGGLQVSASHNPGKYNGCKMVRAGGVPVSGESGITRIRDWVEEDTFEVSESPGRVEEKTGVPEEMVAVLKQNQNLEKIKPMKIVVDAGNGMGAVDVEAMMAGLPIEIVRMNWELDGRFPAHEPDPLKEENLADLKAKVVEVGADLGIAPDGDADRYFFVDEKGQAVRQEILRGIMAQISLRENPGATVCYDIRPGRITRDMIEEMGGRAVVTRVGHSLIKEKMIQEQAVFGGESSGHYFYRTDYGTFEVPTWLVWKFLIWLSESGLSLSSAVKPYQRYSHSGEINRKVDDPAAKIEEIKSKYADGQQSFLDGITVEYPDYWFNIRTSNTEPLLRLNLEARSAELMAAKRDEILEVMGGHE